MSYTPAVRFSNFGDSNIDFNIIFKVKGFVDQYAIKDQIIRGVHKRFGEEGIEINYPVRKLVYPHEVSGGEGKRECADKRGLGGEVSEFLQDIGLWGVRF